MDPTPLIGEPLALDLVNTRGRMASGQEFDLLSTVDDVRRWLSLQSDRLALPLDDVDPAALHPLREAVSEAVQHARRGAPPPQRVLAALSRAQRAAPPHRELSWQDDAVVAVLRRSGEATRDVVAQLAEAAADLLTDPAVRDVRRCEGPACEMLFLPAHPRRRWCSPQLCGNRARVARYYRRHKGEDGARPSTPEPD